MNGIKKVIVLSIVLLLLFLIGLISQTQIREQGLPERETVTNQTLNDVTPPPNGSLPPAKSESDK